ncbi:hypothetical protein BC831DRAFT_405829 [Entophlyctis helioformis]|nr:hypothetical protein BC831DRAFT_405829 [Entophlyctis helioformis]
MPTSSAVDLPPTPALATAPAQPAKQPAAKLTHFDGLRGVVAMTVVFIHYFQHIHLPLYYTQEWTASGRVITVSVLRSGKAMHLISCILRRPIRLLLPMMTIMLLDYMFIGWSESINPPIIQMLIWMWLFDAGRFDLIAGAVWTLRHEYAGSNAVYFLTFLIMNFPNNPRARYTILGLAFGWYLFTHSWTTHFIAGLAIADLAQHGYIEQFKQWRYAPIAKIAIAVFGCAVSFKYSWWNMADTIDSTLRQYQVWNGNMGVSREWWDENFPIFLYSLCFILLLETSTTMQRFYTLRPIQFLGKISFALYLFHEYWMYMFQPMPYIAAVVSGKYLQIFLAIVIWTAPLLVISYFLTDIVDLPSVKVGRWAERVFITEPWDGRLETLFKFETPKPGTTTTTVYGVPIPKIDLMALRRFWDAYAPSFVRRPATAAYAPVRP